MGCKCVCCLCIVFRMLLQLHTYMYVHMYMLLFFFYSILLRTYIYANIFKCAIKIGTVEARSTTTATWKTINRIEPVLICYAFIQKISDRHNRKLTKNLFNAPRIILWSLLSLPFDNYRLVFFCIHTYVCLYINVMATLSSATVSGIIERWNWRYYLMRVKMATGKTFINDLWTPSWDTERLGQWSNTNNSNLNTKRKK